MFRVYAKLLLISAFISLLIVPTRISAQSPETCSDLLVLFARGSGQNTQELDDSYPDSGLNKLEKQSKTFFDEIDKRVTGLQKEFISLHDFPGRYNQYGYEAVSVFGGFSHWPQHRNDVPNRYYESVKDGAEELAWFLEDRLTSCPFQQVILGGYSQGAQVVGDALFIMQARFRPRINYVALYGDPKFNPRTNVIPITTEPWVRGNAWSTQSGILLPRKNYLPDEIANATSWCDFSDPICANYYNNNPIKTTLADVFIDKTHQNIYQEKWIPQSANEIANTLRTKNRILSDKVQTTLWVNKNDKLYQTDLAIVIDTTGSMNTQITNIQGKLDSFVASLLNSYWDTRIGIVAFNDNSYYHTHYKPTYYSKVVSDFTKDKESLKNGINRLKAEWGGDEPEAQYSGLMTAMDTSLMHWRDGAQKKVLVITDAAAKDPDPGPGNYTKQDVINRGLALDPVSISLVALPLNYPWPYINKTINSAMDEEFNNTVVNLALATNGIVTYGQRDYKPEYITDTIKKMETLPVAAINGPSESFVNQPVVLSGGDSYDPDSAIIKYEWDFDNDGVWDYSSSNPLTNYTYTNSYNGLVVLQITSADGGSAKATLNIGVATQTVTTQSTPSMPVASTATPRISDSANITWSNSYDNGTVIKVLDLNGNVLEIASGGNSLTLNSLPDNQIELQIAACNTIGCSEPAILQIPEKSVQTPTPVPNPVVAKPTPTPTPIITPAPTPVAQNQNIIQTTIPANQINQVTGVSQPTPTPAATTQVEGIKSTAIQKNLAKALNQNTDGKPSAMAIIAIIFILTLGVPWLIVKKKSTLLR